jgi:hypothetical protein
VSPLPLSGISPLLLYASLALIPIVLSIIVRIVVIVVPSRECLNCGAELAVTRRTCKQCGYRYAAESTPTARGSR